MKSRFVRAILIPLWIGAASCGYHVGGKNDQLPRTITTIAVPPFTATTARYALVDQIPREIGREFRARTRFAIVTSPVDADAVLSGSINSATVIPAIYDPGSGKATSVELLVNVSVRLVEQKTGKVLYARPNWGIREDYELAVDPHQFFNESGPAQDRLCRDVARDLVSAVLEDF